MSGLYCWTGDHLKWVGNATPLIVLEETLRCYCGQLKNRRKPSDWTPPLPHFVPVHSDGLRVEDRTRSSTKMGRVITNGTSDGSLASLKVGHFVSASPQDSYSSGRRPQVEVRPRWGQFEQHNLHVSASPQNSTALDVDRKLRSDRGARPQS
ncbi:hypothetical protein BGY98DRAFT_1014886 [Russula aff. rugulosa BPL654]|nr:hypothetical protein BGY98DRAFT_1014886 [Russula aff. rugulosa BPL654]